MSTLPPIATSMRPESGRSRRGIFAPSLTASTFEFSTFESTSRSLELPFFEQWQVGKVKHSHFGYVAQPRRSRGETCITKGRDQTYNPLGGYGMTTVLAGRNKPDIKKSDAPPFPWSRPVAEDGSN